MPLQLLASILVYLLKACFVLTIHCMVFGSLGIGKYLLKPRIGTILWRSIKFLMKSYAGVSSRSH